MDSAVEDLRRVAAGLRLVFLGLIAMAVSAMAWLAAVLTLGKRTADPTAILIGLDREHPAAMTVVLALGVLAIVLGIAGKVYCLSVPSEARATRLIVPALVCSGMGLVLWIGGHASGQGEAAAELELMGGIFRAVGYVIFVRFLRQLAGYLGSPRLLNHARLVLLGTLATFLLLLTASLGTAAGAMLPAILAGFVGVLGVLVVFGLYAALVHELRRLTEAAVEYKAGPSDPGRGP
jgi:hypothetical protein